MCFDDDDEEREWFWNDLDKGLYRVGNGNIMCVMEDLNEWV